MMKNRFLFVAMLFAALSLGFVSCDDNKGNEPDDLATEQGGSTENNGGEETPTPEEPVTFTLTLLSSNEAMGTVTEGGTYDKEAEVIIEATATKEAYMFVKWSDGNTENPRTLTMTENIKLTAEFDYAYVDLGLPSGLKWAACNVGATTPEGYGGYFAWGETETKGDYTWDTYKWCNGSRSTLTKYNTSSSYGTVDSKTVLELADDAARANWGGAWRMPTDAEWTELRENCTWTWTTKNGVNGYEVKGLNGNSIFLPAAGYRYNDKLFGAGSYGYYWSGSLYSDGPGSAWDVDFGSDNVDRDNYFRYYGRSVRPVL